MFISPVIGDLLFDGYESDEVRNSRALNYLLDKE